MRKRVNKLIAKATVKHWNRSKRILIVISGFQPKKQKTTASSGKSSNPIQRLNKINGDGRLFISFFNYLRNNLTFLKKNG